VIARDRSGASPIAGPVLVAHRPGGLLGAHVESIWFAERPPLPHRLERSLPTARVDIVIPLLQDSIVRFDDLDAAAPIHYRGAIVSGAHDRFAVRGTGGASSVVGVHFRAGGAAAFFAGALPELRNRTVLLEDLWGTGARDLRARLQATTDIAQRFRIVEDALRARLAVARPVDAMLAQALGTLARDPSAARIGSLQRASGCSAQAFIRRFEAGVGLTPKRYARVLRFSALLSGAVRSGPRDWAGLAAESGYVDQSHLIREFKRLAGLTPSGYAPIRPDQPTHVPIVDERPLRGIGRNVQSADAGGR
jgi:AraC-like DNA-binding protein